MPDLPADLPPRRIRIALALILALVAAVFLPHVGRGFVKDDAHWLDNTVQNGAIDWLRPFRVSTGFYRPLVSVTFAAQYALSGLDPRPYGIFNLLLHLAVVLLLFQLMNRLFASPVVALTIAGLFAFNLKATAMALGWISGRTSLLTALLCLLGLLALPLPFRGGKRGAIAVRLVACAGFFFAGLLAKETAIALLPLGPALLFLTTDPRTTPGRRRLTLPLQLAGLLLLPLAGYLLLRLHSDAFGIGSAPDYYRMRAAPLRLARNLLETAGRGATLDLLLLALLAVSLLALGGPRRAAAALATGRGACRQLRCLPVAWLWFFCFAAPIAALPVRSDLYAYLPQAGLHILAAPWIVALGAGLAALPARRRRAAWSLLAVFMLVWGLGLWQKAAKYGREGAVAGAFMRQLPGVLTGVDHAEVVVVDRDRGAATPSTAIAGAFTPMLRLLFPGRELSGSFGDAERAATLPAAATVQLEWVDGELRPVRR